jgi:DNA-binding transcriptional regulator YiaG
MAALPFCHLKISAPRHKLPTRWKCTQVIPTEPKTLGEHIKRHRLKLHLFQFEVAKILEVDEAGIHNWERGIFPPAERTMPRIAAWLGYDPRHL